MSLPARETDVTAMARALELAAEAATHGDIPVGAVVTDTAGTIIGEGRNLREVTHDPLAHAEVVALRAAAAAEDNYRLPGCELFVTLEPCAMCVGALVHARVARIVYGAKDPKTGACGSIVDLPAIAHWNHHGRFEGGVLADECGALLRGFFADRRR